MKIITFIISFVLLVSIPQVQSQVSINTDGSDADVSAMLDVVSTTKGMLIPRMTTTQRTSIANAANGLLVFDETTSSFWFYKTSTGWEELSTSNNSVSEIDDLSNAHSDANSVFLGDSSGDNNSGIYNCATGPSSLSSNTNGSNNTAFGYGAMIGNIGGDENTAVGKNALANNTGNKNVGFGFKTLAYNQNGNANTAIGYFAGRGDGLGDMSGNIFIGSYAGYYATGDNQLFIDNSSTSTPLIGGNFATNQIDINGTIKITGGAPGLNKVLTSDADGLASWENTGTPATMGIDDLTDGIYDGSNIFLGNNTGNTTTTGSINMAYGYESLTNITSGDYNSALGIQSLQANTSGYENIAVGYKALYTNTTGDNNTAIGTLSGFNGNGNNNTSVGSYSLNLNSTGNDNTAIGRSALYNNNQSNNVALGSGTLKNNTEGYNNTAVGKNAGYTGVNSYGNVFIGYEAGYNETGNNKLYISNSQYSIPLIYGDFSNPLVAIHGDLDVFANTTVQNLSIAGYTEINGTVQITSGTPGANKVLTSDASGNATWENTGTPATMGIDDLTDGLTDANSVFLGTDAGSNDDGSNYNAAVGTYSLQANTSGALNSSLGYSTLKNNTTGSHNIAIGTSAAHNNTAGSENITIGVQSLGNNQGGSRNVAIGYQTGYGSSNPSQSGNIFLGYQAGYSETGSNKLYIDNSNTTQPLIGGDFASNQVDIHGTIKITGGAPGLNKVLTSDASGNATWENTGTPTSMGIDDLTDGINDGSSVFLGTNAGIVDDGGNFNTGNGYYSMKQVIDGQRNTSMGNVSLYDNISGDQNSAFGGFSLRYTTGNQNTAVGYYAGPSSANSGLFNTCAIGYNAIPTASNRVRIGNTSITRIGGQTSWSTLSDKRFKNQIKENVAGLDFIMQLRPVTYHLDVHKLDQFLNVEEENPDMKSKREKEAIQQTGFIAQEVEQAAKDINYNFSGVNKPQNENDHYSIAYAEFVVPLVKAVQEQQSQIVAQQAMIEQMQMDMEKLKKQSK